MIKRAETPTYQDIMNLYRSGDIEGLREMNTLLAKRVNQRMSELERYDMEGTAAYKRATDWLENSSKFSAGQRFSRSKKMTAEDLKDQLIQEANFLRAQTSTRRGEMERREHIFESLTKGVGGQAPAIEVPEGEDLDSFKKKFLEFLDDDAWSELKKHIYTSDILDQAGEAIAAGASIDELNQALKDYNSGASDLDYDEIWQNWIKVE